MLEGDRGFCSSAEDIAEVQAGTNRHAHETRAGKIREPKDLTSAQFSANWSRALFFVKGGAGYSEYTDDALGDQRILDLSRKIHTDVDDEIEYAWQKTKPRGAGMTVRLRSGETYSECVPNLRPMTAEDVDAEFRSLAAVVIEVAQAERLPKAVRNLQDVRDSRTLVPLLTRR
jgi:2-methylcitrate dehydratase PrpD